MQLCSGMLKHRKGPLGWMEFEALVPRQDHTASLYPSLCRSWSPVTDPRHETSLSSAGDGAIPDLNV